MSEGNSRTHASSTLLNGRKTFILNMKDLNHNKFMEGGEAELMDPNEGLELDQC